MYSVLWLELMLLFGTIYFVLYCYVYGKTILFWLRNSTILKRIHPFANVSKKDILFYNFKKLLLYGLLVFFYNGSIIPFLVSLRNLHYYPSALDFTMVFTITIELLLPLVMLYVMILKTKRMERGVRDKIKAPNKELQEKLQDYPLIKEYTLTNLEDEENIIYSNALVIPTSLRDLVKKRGKLFLDMHLRQKLDSPGLMDILLAHEQGHLQKGHFRLRILFNALFVYTLLVVVQGPLLQIHELLGLLSVVLSVFLIGTVDIIRYYYRMLEESEADTFMKKDKEQAKKLFERLREVINEMEDSKEVKEQGLAFLEVREEILRKQE